MNGLDNDSSAKARELRESFDRSFSMPRVPSTAPADDLLLVRICGRRYALRIAELRGLFPGRKVTPLPSADPALLGIVGIRGQLVPTYSLAVLLDFGGGPSEHSSLVLCEQLNLTVALAFDEFVESVRVSESDLHASPVAERLPTHIAQVARIVPETCYVISTGSILKSIARKDINATRR